MNTPLDNADDLRHAEYALGVLDAEARASVEREMQSDPQAAAAVRWWQQRLTPLSEDVAAVVPPDYVWARIREALGHDGPMAAAQKPVERPRLWDSLALWRWIGAGAGVVAAACVVMVVTLHRPVPAPTAASRGYLVARIAQDNGVTGWTATTDLDRRRMVVVPATPVTVAADRSTELWLIPPGHKPVALGLIAGDKATTVTLTDAQLAQLGSKSLLAVSVEPQGGSPTGQPTGPVVAKGGLSGT